MFTKKSNILMGIALCCITLLSYTQASAQQTPADKLAQIMTDSLSYLTLTDTQKSDALNLNKTAAASLVQLSQKADSDTTLKGKALFKQVSGIMKQRNDGLKKLLTSDQQKVFQQHKLAQVADLQTKMMTAQLKLTDEQAAKVYQLNLKETAAMMQDAQKAKQADRKLKKLKAAKALKADMSEKDNALKQILTSDQYSLYEKNKEAMKEAIKEKKNEKK